VTTATANPLIADIEDERLARGIDAVLRAIRDVASGELTCPCPTCELRRITEDEK
jgi:hypothetical protein